MMVRYAKAGDRRDLVLATSVSYLSTAVIGAGTNHQATAQVVVVARVEHIPIIKRIVETNIGNPAVRSIEYWLLVESAESHVRPRRIQEDEGRRK